MPCFICGCIHDPSEDCFPESFEFELLPSPPKTMFYSWFDDLWDIHHEIEVSNYYDDSAEVYATSCLDDIPF